ncbi:MAG: hypothetical protein AAGA15_07070 [Pseudomonadota bacterium]
MAPAYGGRAGNTSGSGGFCGHDGFEAWREAEALLARADFLQSAELADRVADEKGVRLDTLGSRATAGHGHHAGLAGRLGNLKADIAYYVFAVGAEAEAYYENVENRHLSPWCRQLG